MTLNIPSEIGLPTTRDGEWVMGRYNERWWLNGPSLSIWLHDGMYKIVRDPWTPAEDLGRVNKPLATLPTLEAAMVTYKLLVATGEFS